MSSTKAPRWAGPPAVQEASTASRGSDDSALVEALPIPELLWVAPDDIHRDRVVFAVVCPLCWRTHTHDAHITEHAPARVPHCLRRLDQAEQVYTVDLGRNR